MTPPNEAKVHYLKNMPATGVGSATPPPAYTELIKNLEKRIVAIEEEFKKTRESLNKQGVSQIEISADLKNLVKELGEKVQRISQNIPQASTADIKSHSSSPQHMISSLLNSLNPDKIQVALRSLWFGSSGGNFEVDEFGMDPAFVKKVKPLFDFLYYTYWRVSVSGLGNIPGEGRGLIVANHSGTLPYDGSMIAASIVNEHPSRRDVRFLVEDFVYHFPFLGTFMYRIGGVRACPENAERLLSKEHLVAVFPEGIKGIGKHYKNRYHLQRFGRGGFIKLALRMNAPIIPTAVIGAEEIHPLLYKSTLLAKPFGIPYIPVTPTLPWLGLLGLIPLPSKWTILFGEPIRFSPKYSAKDAEDQLLVNQLSEMVRQKIQDMIVEALKYRRSIWFG